MTQVGTSVVICTRNPREAHLSRALAALSEQTPQAANWELIVVDNNSTPPVADRRFAMPPNARLVVESEAGLTPARLRGIAEAAGDLFVCVDDDNVLAPDYLERAVEIAHEFPRIGVWGGRVFPEFERNPEPWMKAHWKNLALVDFDADRWTNQRDFSVFPPGAGMCIRRDVALSYAAVVASDPVRRSLGRRGESLASGEDTDLVLQAVDSRWGIGQFTRLSLTHLIPPERMTIAYHKRLAEGIAKSAGLLNAARASEAPDLLRHRVRGWFAILMSKGSDRPIAAAAARGWMSGLKSGWKLKRSEYE